MRWRMKLVCAVLLLSACDARPVTMSPDLSTGSLAAADLSSAAGLDSSVVVSDGDAAAVDLLSAATDAATACSYDETSDGQAHLLAIYTLPPTSLTAVDPSLTALQLSAALTNGAGTVTAPSLGSGLEYAGGCPGTFYGLGDRGPNGVSSVDNNGVTFPLPAYTPMVAQVTAQTDGTLTLGSVVDFVDGSGLPVTGISNDGNDDVPYLTATAKTPLAYNQNGLDPEDLRRLPNGDFLIGEEYAPSVALVDGSNGQIKARYTPSSETLPSASYPIKAILPAVFTNRRDNKGFEGLALSPDGHTAFVVLQTPMGSTKDAHYADSLVNRILRIDHVDDPASAEVGADLIVLHAPVADFPQESKQASVFYNSASWLSESKLLLIERATGRMTLVVVDLSSATNIVGQSYESTLDPESLASSKGFQKLGITPAATSLVFDSDDTPALIAQPPGGAVAPSKLEGVAVINRTTVAVANDNDFGIDNANDASRIFILRLKAPLPQ